MKPDNLTVTLRTHVERYRVALVDQLLDEVAKTDRHGALRILQTDRTFQLFEAVSSDQCVCLHRGKLPSRISVARSVAIHAFCRSEGFRRTLLTKQTLKKYFPDLFRNGLPGGYYVDTSAKSPVLGLLRVDVHFAPVNRLISRSLATFEKHRRQLEFLRLISNQQFEIAWLVPTESKADAFCNQSAKSQKAGVRLHAECTPILLDLLVPLEKTFPDVAGL